MAVTWKTGYGSPRGIIPPRGFQSGITRYSMGRGQRVIAGVIAERAFVAQRLGRVNVAFDDEVGVSESRFQFRARGWQISANAAKQIQVRVKTRNEIAKPTSRFRFASVASSS
jgi:hypothetical protein